MDNKISFDEMFINILDIVKLRSPDPRTKVGCILASEDRRHIIFGWNSMPSKIKETKERWEDRDWKHRTVIHAEESAIINSKCDLKGWTAYISLPPCESCTRLIIHSGIKEIIYKEEHKDNIKYDYNFSKQLLKEANITINKWEQTEKYESKYNR